MSRLEHALCLTLVGLMSAACGTGDSQSAVAPTATAALPESEGASEPTLGTLRVQDECAVVEFADGERWENCSTPSDQVLAVRSMTTEGGEEVALLRFDPRANLVATSPSIAAFVQESGWAFVQSRELDFEMTFRAQGEDATCEYNPLFIECRDKK